MNMNKPNVVEFCERLFLNKNVLKRCPAVSRLAAPSLFFFFSLTLVKNNIHF